MLRDNIQTLEMLRGRETVKNGMLWVLLQARILYIESLPKTLIDVPLTGNQENSELNDMFRGVPQDAVVAELNHYFKEIT